MTVRLDQNLADRFFAYPLILPAFLFCLEKRGQPRYGVRFRLTSLAVLLGLFGWPYCFALVHLFTDRDLTNSRVAEQIRKNGLEGRLAISEAGILPYVTQWPTVDLWGLNTPAFARRIPQPGNIAALKADLIVLRYESCRVVSSWPPPSTKRTWANMAQNVIRGAALTDDDGWILPYSHSALALKAEQFTDDTQTYLCYFIRRDYRERGSLEQIVRENGGRPLSSF